MDRNDLITRISSRLQDDERVRGAWLSGSLGRGEADDYSDVDVLAVVEADELAGFLADGLEVWRSVAPTVLAQQVGGGPVFNAVTDGWLRFDLSVATPDALDRRSRSTLRPLFDHDGLGERLPASRPVLQPDPDRVSGLITEFFRILGLLPVVIGRDELVVGVSGVGLLRGLLIQLMLQDVAVEDRGGALHLSRLLPPERHQLLVELPVPAASRSSVIAGHLLYAEHFLPLARELSDRLGLTWPDALEQACRVRLATELSRDLPGPD